MHEAILGAHAIDDQLPVEVIELVLPDPGGESIAFEGETFTVEVGGGDPGESRTPDVHSDLGDAQATFLEEFQITTELQVWIHEDHWIRLR